ncbi:MAG: RDD family protein [Hydrotalea sp.]|nr:RDD family protein [Hydrotalea sp.]
MQSTVGTGTRALNFFVDTILVFILAFAAKKVYNFYVFFWGMVPLNFGWFFFGSMVVYYFVLESIWGRTLGKWFSYSKVVNSKGEKPGVLRILLRSISRVILIDMFFIPFLGKTLHDYISGTDVVEV